MSRCSCVVWLVTAIALSGCDDGDRALEARAPALDDHVPATTRVDDAITAMPGVTVTTTSKGTAVRLTGQLGTAVIGHRGADGRSVTDCVDGAQAAETFARHAAASASASAETGGQR